MGETTWVVSSEPLQAALSAALAELRRIGVGSPRIAVAGGSALGLLGAVRSSLPRRAFSQWRLTWVDERCVPFDDVESSRGQAYRLGHLDAERPPALHLPLYLDSESPLDACRRVDNALRHDFDGGLDLLLLGMGEDGHIASLFPGHSALEASERVVAISDSPKPPKERITLTFPLLGPTPAILLATGAGKRRALQALYDKDPALPATHLERLTVITDQPVPDPASPA